MKYESSKIVHFICYNLKITCEFSRFYFKWKVKKRPKIEPINLNVNSSYVLSNVITNFNSSASNRTHRGPCQIRSHLPKQQMVGRIFATSLQLGGCLCTSEILVTISAWYHQEFPAIDVVLLSFARFQRVSVHFWTRIRLRQCSRFDACEETHVSGMSMRNTWKI